MTRRLIRKPHVRYANSKRGGRRKFSRHARSSRVNSVRPQRGGFRI